MEMVAQGSPVEPQALEGHPTDWPDLPDQPRPKS